MGGHCIESEDFVIVVDKWDGSFLRRPGCKPHYFFLTHLHADHISGLTSTWSRTIYTSPFNAWLLPMRRNVKQILLREVELNVTHTIRKANNEIAFQVTLLDANHCPGAVMFLFQGKFGNILYTGDFRYTPRILENPVLSPIIRNKELSVLYLDNTYAAPTCKFPSREIALKQVLKIIDENPDSKILIGMRQLGKEEVLRAIALHVNEKVCVSNQRFQILSKLEYEDVFTTDISLSRIHAVELHTITQRHCQESTKTVSIKLTSMYECGNADKQRGNIYVVPYSDHSSHDELKEFVDHLRPLKLYPILIPKISKGTAVPGPWHRMSAVNCVVPEEILQLCGPAPENGAPSTTHPEIDLPQLLIKYHPASKPVSVEKKSSSVTYIDEGLNFVPFDSLGSHLTNNNKARKHIKASWTRLAPKLLTPKGVKFDSSPEKNSEPSQDSLQMARVMDESSSGILVPTRNKGDIPCDPSVKENSVIESDGTIVDLPLSDDDYDMPSSASELIRQLNLSASESVNGVGSEDRKSECSSVITDLFEDTGNVRMTRNRSKCESPAKGVNDSKDSVSDVSSSKRTTRSKASVTSVPVFSRPRTRLSHGSDTDSHVNNESPRKAQVGVRKSLRNSPNAQSPSPVSPKSAKNGLGRKSVSLESLPTKSTIKELKKVTKEVKDADIFLSPGSPSKKPTKVTNDSKNNACKIAECIPSPTGNVSPKKRVPVILETINVEEEHQKQNDSSSVSIVGATNSAPIGSSNVITGNQAVGTSSNTSAVSTDSSTENCNVPATVSKKTVNGNVFLSNFNGIHINSPGRKRVPLSCDWDAAQEIVKKETEQALKALECLNQMKGFKTRNRSGPAAQRRLSADNIPKSPAKKVASPGIRRRTASILSSMASTFSQQPETKEAATPSQPARCVQGISPILPDKDTRSPRKAKGGGPGKMGSGQKNSGSSKRKEPQLIPEAVESKAVAAGQSTYLSSVVKIENPMDVDVGVSQSADSEDLPSSVSLIESTEPVLLPKVESCVNNDSEVTSGENSRNTPEEPHVSAVVSNRDADDILNQGLFLTDETLASASSSSKKEFKQPRRTYYKKQTEVNVNLMKLKMDFAMSRKGPKRLSLPSRLSFLRRDYSSKQSMLQSKDKVQDWKNKISMRLRKSPQRRYKFKSPNKLRENAKRTLASILRSGRNLNSSQEYQGDVEDCTELSQPISEAKENSGYTADNEDVDSTQPSSVPTVHRQTRSSHQRTLSDSSASEDSKVGILNEVRRSSRLSKEDVNCFQVPSRPVKSLPKHNSKQENSKANSKGVQVETNPPQKKTGTLPLDNVGGPSAGTSVARFSSRLSERSQMASSKGTENVLAQKSPNILSLMADAFKNNTVSSEAPSTANILCSMAENFKRLDDATRVSPSLSIQLVSSKVPVSSRPPRDRNSTDWGVQITRVDSALSKSQTVSQNLSSGGLSVRNAIPKSLSIEIIPDSDVVDVAPRKGPSPPTVTISPEVIDLASDSSESQVDSTQSTIHSLPLSDGPRRLPQGGTRWPKIPKSEILSPPQAVWKEKRSSSQTGDNVIIDIQTQEDPQKVPHCPVHCTCGAAMRQGTCMGTMRNLIEEDADCLYEVPLSPEDFEECGAMLALGRGWIESCFDDPEDRDEFFQSYEDILPTVSDWKQRRAKSLSENSKSGGVQPAPQSVQPVRRVLSLASPKPTVQCVKHAPTAAAAAQRPLLQHTVVKNQTATSSQTKAPKTVPKINQAEEPKKKPSSCLKEIEKKIIAYNDEKSKKESERKSLPSRRTSSQSTSSSNSASRSRSSTKQSLSPIAPPPPKVKSTISKRKLNAPNSSNDPKEKKQKVNTSSSGSESPESKKPRCNELDRLSDIGKNSANRRYRVSVRRSLDHLMTRQKLRSDRRVKASNSSRS